MKIGKNGGKKFEPCPQFEGRAVCVDVTEPELRQTKFGPKQQFKLVFEVDQKRADGTPFAVWSKWFTPTSHEKSAFRAFLKSWMGREMTDAEWETFDTEDLLHRPARVIIIHERDEDDIFANIQVILPHRPQDGDPLKPSGTFKRKKDREENGGSYKKTEPAPATEAAPAAEPVAHWSNTKVHVGKFRGHEVADLSEEGINGLINMWLPTAKANPKPSADDKRLMHALEQYLNMKAEKAAITQDDDVPY